jgi:hypothetical protein
MEWTRSETLALATHACVQCHGLGLRGGDKNAKQPCNCVLRAIFRACLTRFYECSEKQRRPGKVTLEDVMGRETRRVWGRKDEEYVADFCLVSQRNLSEDEYRLFKFHFLLGAEWKLCCAKLKIDRGIFFHMVYRIEQNLGRIFRELEPHALYPLQEYFYGAAKYVSAKPIGDTKVVPIRPPVARKEIDLPESIPA